MTSRHVTLAIYGLSCGGGGALTVEESITKTVGVVRVYVNPATEMAYVDYDPESCNLGQLVASVEGCGLHATVYKAR